MTSKDRWLTVAVIFFVFNFMVVTAGLSEPWHVLNLIGVGYFAFILGREL